MFPAISRNVTPAVALRYSQLQRLQLHDKTSRPRRVPISANPGLPWRGPSVAKFGERIPVWYVIKMAVLCFSGERMGQA